MQLTRVLPCPALLCNMSKTGLPAISWTANENYLTWLLLTEMEKYEDYHIIFGKVDKEEVRPKFYAFWCVFLCTNSSFTLQNTSSDRKVQVYKCIGETVLPDLYKINGSALGDRIKGKINSYVSNSCSALHPSSKYMPSLHKEYVSIWRSWMSWAVMASASMSSGTSSMPQRSICMRYVQQTHTW